MKQESQINIKYDDSTNQIEYSCFYSRCKFCRYLCQYCKLGVNYNHKTHIANKEEYQQQQQSLKQSIKSAKFEIYEYENYKKGLVGTISNDLKYVVIGDQSQDLKIWDHSKNNLIKTIQFNNRILYVKFTEDSKILYVMTLNLTLYKFNANHLFKQVQTYQCRGDKDSAFIRNIYYISNEISLTSFANGYIHKINVQQKKQLLKIKAHSVSITCSDYNKSLNIIVIGSLDKSISFLNANDGQLLILKQLAHSNAPVSDVKFMINNQLISQDKKQLVIIWNIDYQTNSLSKQQTLKTFNDNIQVVLHQQFLISTGEQSVKIYSTDGELISKFDHNLYITYGRKLIQPDSMQSCLIFGWGDCENKQLVIEIKFD